MDYIQTGKFIIFRLTSTIPLVKYLLWKMTKKGNRVRIVVHSSSLVIILSILVLSGCTIKKDTQFDSIRAYQDIEYQLSLGPRTMGSEAHQQLITWATLEFERAGWDTELQEVSWSGNQIKNIIAKRGEGNPWIILGAHYDSRFYSDQDPDPNNYNLPVPGANDGASGVAVLLELARAIPADLDKNIWIVLFDAEDNGNLPGWDWIMGSQAFVANLSGQPDAVVIVDMIGDADLDIYLERNSDVELSREIWLVAETLGYNQFIPEYKYTIIDDHLPFVQAGIPAIDIIDLDYPYWHTTLDTADKISEESLDAVGETILAWLTR
jgi:glutaminyl-peptide cyclotransferase